jgi:hypothetical protein
LAPIVMAIQSTGFSAAASPFCRPEEDPFLLLESCGKAIESILRGHAGQPLRRTWIDRPYGEEEISRLEEEVLPAIQQCLARVDEIDSALESEQLEQQRVQEEAEQLEAEADALHWEGVMREAGRAGMGY